MPYYGMIIYYHFISSVLLVIFNHFHTWDLVTFGLVKELGRPEWIERIGRPKCTLGCESRMTLRIHK